MGERAVDGGLFASLIVKNDRRLLRYILTLIPRHSDAEEILQRTATALWENFDQYDTTRDFYPWASRFAYFEVLKFRRDHARERLIFREDILEQLAETRSALDDSLEERRDALMLCLGQMATEEIGLLRRRYCSPETIALLAQEIGSTAKALYRRLDRIRDRLVECVNRRVAAKVAKE